MKDIASLTSQVKAVADRMKCWPANSDLVCGLRFMDEPAVRRFSLGWLAPFTD